MQFQTLSLEKYGRFAGLSLDFTGKDVLVHIVHGPNEAGKSTALSAICDLLFGFGHITPYNFRHESPTLRIGATLVNAAGQSLSFKRRKGKGNTLIKPDESGEFPDSALAGFLGGVDRDKYERLFGLNHERLRRGGKAMLEADGDIGRSLFEAGSGTTGLADVVQALAKDADGLGSPGGRKAGGKPYWFAHERFTDALGRIRSDAMKPEAWTAATRKLRETEEQRQAIVDQLARIASERNAVERIRRVLPLLRRISELRDALQVLEGGADLPDGFEDTWRDAVEEERSARERCEARQDDLNATRESLEELGDAGVWPLHKAAIEGLITALGEYRSHERSLPNRQREIMEGRKRMADLLRRLGLAHENPDQVVQLMPTAAATSKVRTLITEHTRLDTASQSTLAELKSAIERREAAEADLSAAATPADPSVAVATLDGRHGLADSARRVSEARAEVAIAQQALSDQMASLGRGALSANELAALALPSDGVVLRFEREFDALETERRDALSSRKEHEEEARRLAAELETLKAAGEIPTATAIAAARTHRDSGWRLIRRRHVDNVPIDDSELAGFSSDGDIATAYEAAVQTADHLVDSKEREAARVQRYASLTAQLSKTRSDIEVDDRDLDEIARRHEDTRRRWEELWASTRIEFGTPTEMRGWLAQKDAVLRLRQALVKAASALDTRTQEEKDARDLLISLAEQFGVADPNASTTDLLLARVKAACTQAKDDWTVLIALRKAATDCARGEQARRKAHWDAEAKMAEWQTAWSETMSQIGLAATASVAEAEGALDVWRDIEVLEADLAQTRKRRDQLQDAVGSYREAVRNLIKDLGDGAADLDPEADVTTIVPILQERLRDAGSLTARRADAQRRLADAEAAHAKALLDLEDAAENVAGLRLRYGLTADDDVVALSRRAADRRQKSKELEAVLADLSSQGGGLGEEELREEADATDADGAAAKTLKLEADSRRLQEELEAVAQALAHARNEVKRLLEQQGIGDAVQTMNDAAAEMGALTERWMRLRAASVILTAAIERYRAANQDPLVTRASAIFAAMAGTSDNPITRLSVDYADEARPSLVAYRRDGSQLQLSGMSDGTLDQLYLSLRIAAIERYVETAEPLPFIADDLFITSDEDRTIPGIQALAELGKKTQVILFTHHQYVVDCAVSALAPHTVKVHSLAGERAALEPA